MANSLYSSSKRVEKEEEEEEEEKKTGGWIDRHGIECAPEYMVLCIRAVMRVTLCTRSLAAVDAVSSSSSSSFQNPAKHLGT